jgi:glucose-1-phosphate cytidylyltransferase
MKRQENIPVMILAGGMGTRLGSSHGNVPKPMLLVGGKPILWHIMKYYSHFGFNKFILCLGHQGDVIKDYFINLRSKSSDCTVNTSTGQIKFHSDSSEDWQITFADTGQDCMTGGRVARAAKYVDADTFMLTYGDGLCDVNLDELLKFHMNGNRIATVTAVQPNSQFGVMEINGDKVVEFKEKVPSKNSWINGGFFVLNKKILSFLSEDSESVFEEKPLNNLANNNELSCFKHQGFWQCVDTLKDLKNLQNIWDKNPPWKVWGFVSADHKNKKTVLRL